MLGTDVQSERLCLAYNVWRYVFGLPCMAYRVTITANGKLKYTACYVLGGLSALN
jgi:hypothetical protein